MNKHLSEERLKFQLDRIALFSDAVFAIAMTLLVIEIKVPVLSDDDSKTFATQLPHAFKEMIPELVGFVISFFVIGNYWRSHHSTFGYVTNYNRKLLALNNLFLFTIVCMPFTTAFMSRYMFFQPYIIYCANVIVTGLVMIRMWLFIANKKSGLHHAIPAAVVKYKTRNALLVIGCFVVSIIVSIFFGSALGRLCLLLVFIIEFFHTRFYRRKHNIGEHL